MIPICNLTQYGSQIIGSVYLYLDNGQIKTCEGKYCNRDLPNLDIVSYTTTNRGIATLIGVAHGNYVISLGSTLLYLVNKNKLLSYVLSNVKFKSNNVIDCIDGKLKDLSGLFPDSKIRYISDLDSIQCSSLGVAKKFYATYDNKPCVVKFAKLSDRELYNERLYYEMGSTIGVEVCKSILSVYSGKKCSISFLEYELNKDMFTSFKSLGGNVGQILGRLNSESLLKLDKAFLFDYLMSQQDRHLSNLALCNGEYYPLFDNGECLGLGAIGQFSQGFRNYIEHKDKEYLSDLISVQKLLNIIKVYRSSVIPLDVLNSFHIVLDNLRRLGLI